MIINLSFLQGLIFSMKMYNTKQKSLIIDFFKNSPDKCFSAKQIIQSNELEMGQATVYRMLSKLSEEGVLKKFISEYDGCANYRLNNCNNCDSHFHLKCLKCGEIIHTDCDIMGKVGTHLAKDHNFVMDNSKTIIYGVCKDCK
ncbi:MAG: transcriptional repressor [Ruminococcaceae bacterium]|nr:transcriptional repressor [Oscillospiraceae bacterium]